MKTISIVLMLVIAGPAFAETGAGKPFIYDSAVPGLKSFVPPTPVTIGGAIVMPPPNAGQHAPPIELRPTTPSQKPAPQPPKPGLG